MARPPSRGEVWLAALDPIRGHEHAGTRLVVIVSSDSLNHGSAGLVIALPLTTRARRMPSRIEVVPPDGGVREERSFIVCEGIRSLAIERLVGSPWGSLFADTMAEVEKRLAFLLAM